MINEETDRYEKRFIKLVLVGISLVKQANQESGSPT